MVDIYENKIIFLFLWLTHILTYLLKFHWDMLQWILLTKKLTPGRVMARSH